MYLPCTTWLATCLMLQQGYELTLEFIHLVGTHALLMAYAAEAHFPIESVGKPAERPGFEGVPGEGINRTLVPLSFQEARSFP